MIHNPNFKFKIPNLLDLHNFLIKFFKTIHCDVDAVGSPRHEKSDDLRKNLRQFNNNENKF